MSGPNKTFRNGPNYYLNACVGENSGGDNRIGYALGFGEAVKIMLSAAIHEQYADRLTTEANVTFMDTLIYPICFCARHHIELFLKREIHNVSSIRQKTQPIPMNHNLENLWKKFFETCSLADRRLKDLASPMSEYILDYAAIDPTGETFRYAQNRRNIENLTDIGGVINLEVLAQRFDELSKMIELFEDESKIIVSEYNTGTYTSKLSRSEIFELANQLPPRSQWATSSNFDVVRSNFRTKYELSSNDFQRAIRKIESNPQLSAIIGKELPLEGISQDFVDRINNVYLQNQGAGNLSKEEWAALDAIYQIGRSFEYSEHYALYFNETRLELIDVSLPPKHILKSIVANRDRFENGLKKLGQNRLLKTFQDDFFSKIRSKNPN